MRRARFFLILSALLFGLLSAPDALSQQGPTFARDYVYGPNGEVAVTVEPDIYGPFAPSGTDATLSGSCASDGIDIVWATTTDIGSGVSYYRIYRNGGWIANVTGATSYHDGNISAKQTYHYHTAAVDVAGNQGASSPESNSVSYGLCISSPIKQPEHAAVFSHIFLFGVAITENPYSSVRLPIVNGKTYEPERTLLTVPATSSDVLWFTPNRTGRAPLPRNRPRKNASLPTVRAPLHLESGNGRER